MFGDIKFSKNCELFINTCLPYKIEKLKNNKYIFVNKQYKPLGIYYKVTEIMFKLEK